jgi:hypothetical protein
MLPKRANGGILRDISAETRPPFVIKETTMTNRSDIIRQLSVIVTLAVTIAVNAVAGARGINGRLTGAISDDYPVYFTPAGYVFSIWGLIYLALIVWAVWQALPRQRNHPLLRRITPLFIIGSLANIGWLLLWHYDRIPASMILMVVLLLSLIMIYLIIGVGRTAAPRSEKIFLHFPFSIYLGWITVATVANATVALYDIGWNRLGLSEPLWAVIMIIVAALVAILVSWRHADWAYVGVIAWAFVGIVVAQWERSMPVGITAAIMAVLVLFTLTITIPNRRGTMLSGVRLHS